jgi:hypothetical protein
MLFFRRILSVAAATDDLPIRYLERLQHLHTAPMVAVRKTSPRQCTVDRQPLRRDSTSGGQTPFARFSSFKCIPSGHADRERGQGDICELLFKRPDWVPLEESWPELMLNLNRRQN